MYAKRFGKRVARLFSRMIIVPKAKSYGAKASRPGMYAMVYMTVPDETEARALVRHLVEEGLVACGNIFPIHSIYRWQGEVQQEPEIAVIMKTRRPLVERALEEIRRRHSHDVPCAVAYAMDAGLEDYLRWIDGVTS